MITAIFISFLKFVLVLVMLVAMVMVLMGISHLSHVEDEARQEETDALQREVEEDSSVMSSYSVFHRFLARDIRGKR